MPSCSSGRTNSSIRSASGMQEAVARLSLDPLVGPVGMLRAQERRFVSPQRPIPPVCGAPALLGAHPPQDLELLGAGLLAGVHESTLAAALARVRALSERRARIPRQTRGSD